MAGVSIAPSLSKTSAVVVERKQVSHFSHSRVLELDGFRAAAVLMVLVHHLFYGWPLGGSTFSLLPRVLVIGIVHGWLGVDLFFILSGFLITGILLDSKESEHYFRNFYTRRILRIAPLYFACILV